MFIYDFCEHGLVFFQYCESHGFILAEIHNCAENDEVIQYLKQADSDGTKRFWLGLTDTAVEGRFVWQSNLSLAGYTFWTNGEPNNSGGNENCGGIDKEVNYRRWNDANCDTTATYYALCQKGMTLKSLFH